MDICACNTDSIDLTSLSLSFHKVLRKDLQMEVKVHLPRTPQQRFNRVQEQVDPTTNLSLRDG